MKIIFILLTTIILSSCASDKASQNLYSDLDVGKAIKIKACTVVSSRSVTIREDHAGDQGETLGFFAGNIASRNKNNRPLSGFLGGLLGGAIGRNLSDTLHERDGVEYTVLLSNGNERQLVQDIDDGESILTSGDACRLQISGSSNRVLPAKHYPEAVSRPKKVEFID